MNLALIADDHVPALLITASTIGTIALFLVGYLVQRHSF